MCGKKVKMRVQARWSGWGRVCGVICDTRVAVRVKGKVYNTEERPVLHSGLETAALTKR